MVDERPTLDNPGYETALVTKFGAYCKANGIAVDQPGLNMFNAGFQACVQVFNEISVKAKRQAREAKR